MTVLRQSESVTGGKEVLVQKMSDTPPSCFNQLFALQSICTPSPLPSCFCLMVRKEGSLHFSFVKVHI